METINTGYWVRIQEGTVTDCWDTPPPEDQINWFEAVEIIPELTPNREGITEHAFDITTNPVRIVWNKRFIEVDERKNMLIAEAKNTFLKVVQGQMDLQLSANPLEEFDTDIVASVSRNGGTNFTNVTLSDSGYVTGSSGQRILTGTATISGQPSGQSMRWKLELANNTVKIHGVSLSWA